MTDLIATLEGLTGSLSPISPERMQEYIDNACARLGLVVVNRADLEYVVEIANRNEYSGAGTRLADLLHAKGAKDGL